MLSLIKKKFLKKLFNFKTMPTNPIYEPKQERMPEATYCETCGKFETEDEIIWLPPYWFKERYKVTYKLCPNNCQK